MAGAHHYVTSAKTEDHSAFSADIRRDGLHTVANPRESLLIGPNLVVAGDSADRRTRVSRASADCPEKRFGAVIGVYKWRQVRSCITVARIGSRTENTWPVKKKKPDVVQSEVVKPRSVFLLWMQKKVGFRKYK
jgi:hypothetical protein